MRVRVIFGLIVMVLLSCEQPGGLVVPAPVESPSPEPKPEPDPEPEAVGWTAAADGANGTQDSTAIVFSFEESIADLRMEDITLTDSANCVVTGGLAGDGTVWSLGITVIHAGNVDVGITKTGVQSGTQPVTVHKYEEPVSIAYTVAADGDEWEVSTRIDFAFGAAVADLAINDIRLDDGTGSVYPMGLTGAGQSWSLAIITVEGGDITVGIDKSGIDEAGKPVTVYMPSSDPTPPPVEVVKTNITILSPPEKVLYALGEPFSKTGLEVGWLYSDGTIEPVPEGGYEIEAEPNMNKPVNQRVYVRAGSYRVSFWVSVSSSSKILNAISISYPAGKTQEVGKEFDKAGLVITGSFSDGSNQDLASYANIVGYDKFKRGTQTVTVKVNGKTGTFDVTNRIGEGAFATINHKDRWTVGNPQEDVYKGTYIRNEAIVPAMSNIKIIVNPGGKEYAPDTVSLTLENGGLLPEDFASITTTAGYNAAQTGKQTLSMTLDGRTFTFDVFVIDTEPAVWFDYGYMRHAGDPGGHGPGAGKYYAKPNETLVIAPVRYLLGYNADHSDAGATYDWSVSGGATYTTSKDGELLRITPTAEGICAINVTVTGTSYITGSTISESASTELVCFEGSLPTGTFGSPPGVLRHFGAGQMSESGTGYGWSLGSAGGYEVWTVEHQPSYKIEGNAFGSWQEAGVVWMQEDNNGNGLPDEMWYELRGSDEDNATWKDKITRRYAVTYINGSPDATKNQYGQTIRDVYWADSKGRSGLIPGGFPSNWGVTGDIVTYTGTLLRDDGNIATGNYGGMDQLEGYADAIGDTFFVNKAMRADGTPVTLSSVKFIKVQTALFRYGGIFGDVSTEIQYADFLGVQSSFPKPQ
ncbi:MAG: bacterial Ig-like domain-containing protein [Spirochaetaceae bacterium]|jgi:hypothetical protein|nr:bacterial Ig-like domain-containing protein [Spirochaetaceae bacterium]